MIFQLAQCIIACVHADCYDYSIIQSVHRLDVEPLGIPSSNINLEVVLGRIEPIQRTYDLYTNVIKVNIS
jgi:hypothetical protein